MHTRHVVKGLLGPDQDLERFEWQFFREGVEIAPLYDSGGSGPSAALLRYAPGARVPEHEHTGHEHILVLRGSQRDERDTYEVGTCVIHGPGTRHRVASEAGCVVLAVWVSPVRFVGA